MNKEQFIKQNNKAILWKKFIKAIKEFNLVCENDLIIIVKSNLYGCNLVINLFEILKKYSIFYFDFIVLENKKELKKYNNYKLILLDNYSDQIDNILLNLFENNIFTGLMPKKKLKNHIVIRPLYYISFLEIKNYNDFFMNKEKIKKYIYNNLDDKLKQSIINSLKNVYLN